MKIDYGLVHAELEKALTRAHADVDASEAHGQLCGMLSVSDQIDTDMWISQVLGEYDPNDLLVDEVRGILTALHDKTREELVAGNFELNVLLGGDDDDLEARVEALSHWCQGFLFGMSAAGVSDVEKLPGDVGEVVRDFLDISRAVYDEESDDEQNESAYAEVVEYLRVGAMLIHSEFNKPSDDEDEETPTLH